MCDLFYSTYQTRNIFLIFKATFIDYLNKQTRKCSHELTYSLHYKNTPVIIAPYYSSFGTFGTVLNQIRPRDEICLHFTCIYKICLNSF